MADRRGAGERPPPPSSSLLIAPSRLASISMRHAGGDGGAPGRGRAAGGVPSGRPPPFPLSRSGGAVAGSDRGSPYARSCLPPAVVLVVTRLLPALPFPIAAARGSAGAAGEPASHRSDGGQVGVDGPVVAAEVFKLQWSWRSTTP